MSSSSRGSRTLRSILSSSPSSHCSQCAATRLPTMQRFYSAAAAVVVETTAAAAASPHPPSLPSSLLPPPGSTPTIPTLAPAEIAPAVPSPFDIRSGLILTRPPLLTRPLHPFESAFFFYQKRLEERLNSAYIPAVHFKPDTPRRLDWDIKIGERRGAVARELGGYQGRGARAWDDELPVGERLSDPDEVAACLLRDARARVSDDAEIIPEKDVRDAPQPASRVTEADERGDVRRLDRKLDRTLYLVVEGRDGWEFPAGDITDEENLHEAAKRILDQAAGVNMNTWIVGRVPVAHVIDRPFFGKDGAVEKRGRKTFFLRGRIMAGQADLKGNPFGYKDFKWLTREELQELLRARYFRGVCNMMSDR